MKTEPPWDSLELRRQRQKEGENPGRLIEDNFLHDHQERVKANIDC